MSIATCDYTIVQQIEIHAPAERIFRALTDPRELLRWWRVEGKFRALEMEADVRPGGLWHLKMEGSCGLGAPTHIVRGRYLEVEPPSTLVYTWLRDGEEYPESTVRWDLEEKDGVTRVHVTHSGLISEEMRSRNNGWALVQQLLLNYLDPTA